ncbi:MAG: hypothetical protein WC346_05120 [Methanogenium sp.]|jgi:hypothetical protein
MAILNPEDYIRRVAAEQEQSKNNQPASDLVVSQRHDDQDAYDSVRPTQQSASQFSGYESDTLNYNEQIFTDDSIDGVVRFLAKTKTTATVREKFLEIYSIAASKDAVLTWSNGNILRRRADMFKIQMLEFKQTLLGADSDSLLFSDFDFIIEVLCARLETRNSRSFEGFERRAGVTQITHQINSDGTLDSQIMKDEKSGLSKLGRLNPFKG